MNTESIKKNTHIYFLALIGAIAYGFFAFTSMQSLYFLGSGDINELVNYFDDHPGLDTIGQEGIGTNTAFRYAVIFLGIFFQTEFIIILSYIAFITASISFGICAVNIRSSKHLIYVLPLFLMIFFSPNVIFLFSSGIRSAIAFAFLLLAIVNKNLLIRYILFVLSSVIHISMIPIIALYFLFYILRDRRINISSLSSYFLLFLYSISVVYFAYRYQYNVTLVNSSIFYNFLIFCLALLLLFSSKKSIKNVYGFMSIGIILIVVAGNFIDVSFSRYTGNALIFYLFFLVKEAYPSTLMIFSFGYVPFFILTLYFSALNPF